MTTIEERYVLGVAYQAGRDPLIKRGADGGRDFFTADELEKASRTFLKSGAMQIGIEHADGTMGHADVVESYIYRGPLWQQPDGTVVKSGDWLVGAVLDEPTWAQVKTGRITGWSPQGTAKRRRSTAE
jgi:hypothetical protein